MNPMRTQTLFPVSVILLILSLFLAYTPLTLAQSADTTHSTEVIEAETGSPAVAENHSEGTPSLSETSSHGSGESVHAVEGTAHEGTEEEESEPPEIPDILLLMIHALDLKSHALVETLKHIRVVIYSAFVAFMIAFLLGRVASRLKMVPNRAQSALEIYVEVVYSFVTSILGKEMGRRYFPLLATLGIYIVSMNLLGLVPGLFSPTSVPLQTFGLSITVFCIVQYTAIRHQGVTGYLYHLAGEPKDAITWALSPLFFPLHTVGELIKPVSLALRLWGNILGEDILLGVFSMFGIMLVPLLTGLVGWHVENPVIGIPLHLLVVGLVLLGGIIQALVFTALTTIYISLVLPHETHSEEHAPAGAH
jgi:F-type H+-transporting ATPase subunit a